MSSHEELSYSERMQKMVDEGAPRPELLSHASRHNEHAIDLDNLPRQTHSWVKRGIVLSCEGAGHPSHRHFLVNKR